MGGASVHIKVFGSTLIPLQIKSSTEGTGPPLSNNYAAENTERLLKKRSNYCQTVYDCSILSKLFGIQSYYSVQRTTWVVHVCVTFPSY